MDRRKRKTREAIFQACIELMKEKDFQQITINDIVKMADINRGTFYLHFVDKYDMIASYEKEMINKIEFAIINNSPKENNNLDFVSTRYDTIVELLKCFKENKELYQLIMKSGYYNKFQEELRKRLKIVFDEKFESIITKLNKNIPVDLFIRFLTTMFLNLAEYSYEEENKLNPEELAKFFFNIIVNGPTRALGFLTEEEIQKLLIKEN